jgi:NADPH2:quinone reductase
MRALVCRHHGAPETLVVDDVVDPVPGPGEVLVAVGACAAAHHDVLQVAGTHQVRHEPPFVPGMEAAGVVAALGPGVDGPSVGTAVMALVQGGAMAELAVAEASQVWQIGDDVSFVDAAAMAMAHTTAFCGLRWEADLEEGEWLLVTGAAGAVGLAAVEIGAVLGANVIAVASSAARLELARRRGARHLLNHAEVSIRDAVADLTGGEGVDVAFDPVTGWMYDDVARSIGWGGRHVIVGFAGGEIPRIHAGRLLVKNRRALGLVMRYYRYRRPERMAEAVRTLFDWRRAGLVVPVVSRTGGLDDLPGMLGDIRDRRSTGRLVGLP